MLRQLTHRQTFVRLPPMPSDNRIKIGPITHPMTGMRMVITIPTVRTIKASAMPPQFPLLILFFFIGPPHSWQVG